MQYLFRPIRCEYLPHHSELSTIRISLHCQIITGRIGSNSSTIMPSYSYVLSDDDTENLQCFLVAGVYGASFTVCEDLLNVPQYPAVSSRLGVLFGSSSICRGLAIQHSKTPAIFGEASFDNALDIEEYYVRPSVRALSSSKCKN